MQGMWSVWEVTHVHPVPGPHLGHCRSGRTVAGPSSSEAKSVAGDEVEAGNGWTPRRLAPTGSMPSIKVCSPGFGRCFKTKAMRAVQSVGSASSSCVVPRLALSKSQK